MYKIDNRCNKNHFFKSTSISSVPTSQYVTHTDLIPRIIKFKSLYNYVTKRDSKYQNSTSTSHCTISQISDY